MSVKASSSSLFFIGLLIISDLLSDYAASRWIRLDSDCEFIIYLLMVLDWMLTIKVNSLVN
jgi:hypothetical protein